MKKVGIAVAVMTGLLFTSSVASAQLCIVGIFAKAIYVSANQNRELTAKEAMSCGLLSDDPEKPTAAKKKKKVAGAAKKN